MDNHIKKFIALTGFEKPTNAQIALLSCENDCVESYDRRDGITTAHVVKCVAMAENVPNSIQTIVSPNIENAMNIAKQLKYDISPQFNHIEHTCAFLNGSVIKFKNMHQFKNAKGEIHGVVSADMSNDIESVNWLKENKTSMCISYVNTQ